MDKPCRAGQLKKIQHFLSTNAEASSTAKKRQPLKNEETTALLAYAEQELFYLSAGHENSTSLGGAASHQARTRAWRTAGHFA
jgi:hypothetical protein